MEIRCTVATEKVGSEIEEIIEIPPEDIEGKTEDEINEICEEAYKEWMWDRIEGDWTII